MEKNIIGLIDADLLDNGTRHPNLALMKVAGFLRDHGVKYELVFYKNNLDIYSSVFMSKVFTFTKEPDFIKEPDLMNSIKEIYRGGTGYYATEEDNNVFFTKRSKDMSSLEKNHLLSDFDPKTQMPDYNLYSDYVDYMIKKGNRISKLKDYIDFSIGFATRGCFRQCEFCVNRLEKKVYRYSKVKDFLDVNRKYVYLWDDNILAYQNWREVFEELDKIGKPFQFKQGMDLRLMTEEKAEVISNSKYHGDYIFAFDYWKDREIIERKLKLLRKYTKHSIKLYLFCGFKVNDYDDNIVLYDIISIFKRIKVIMKYGCLGYVMRHENYKNTKLSNIYVQVANWVNQPQMYKKLSFKEFIDKKQNMLEKGKKGKAISTYNNFIEQFPEKKEELIYLFENVKYERIIDDKYKPNKDK